MNNHAGSGILTRNTHTGCRVRAIEHTGAGVPNSGGTATISAIAQQTLPHAEGTVQRLCPLDLPVHGSQNTAVACDAESEPDPQAYTRVEVAETGSLSSRDPCDTERTWWPWNLCVTTTARADYRYHLRYLKTPGLVLRWERFDSACRLRGIAPECLVLALPLRLGSASRYWGDQVIAGQLPAMPSGPVDWTVDAGQTHVILQVRHPLLRQLDMSIRRGFERAAGTHRIPVRPAQLEPLSDWVCRVIADRAQYPGPIRREEAASLESELGHRLAEVIDVPRLADSGRNALARRRGLERALQYLWAAHLPGVTVPELARRAGVSARTLEYAFRETFDLTPLGFLRLLRLHAARRELADPDADGSTVGGVADRWGFLQHGRFSAEYSQAFGELPTETRRRDRGGAGKDALAAAQGPQATRADQPFANAGVAAP